MTMLEIPENMIGFIRQRAARGVFDGLLNSPRSSAYFAACCHFHGQTGTVIFFTRDVGHHSGGWFKNPDYERCLHLSLSFRAPQLLWPARRLMSVHALQTLGLDIASAPYDHSLARQWGDKLFFPDARLAWIETPKSPEGAACDMLHYRVFCDQAWRAIKPRGEVYSTELTAAGWRSWSDVNAPMPSHINAD
jgi:hypothetical protein